MRVRKTFQFLAVAVAAVVSSAAATRAAVITKTYEQSLDNGNFSGLGTLFTRIDFNLDGTNDFSFYHQTSVPKPSPSNTFDYNGKLTMDSATPSQFLAFIKDFDTLNEGGTLTQIGNYVETLPVGFSVGQNGLMGFIVASPGATAFDHTLLDSSGTGNTGAFSVATGERDPLVASSSVAYVGFAFGSVANPNYGYLVFTKIGNDDSYYEGDRNAATLSRVVYETTPGKPLVIGGVISSVPEPTTLAALAGAGLSLLRRRRRD